MKAWTRHDQTIESFYESFRSEYLKATAKYSLSVEDRIDIYQEAIIVLYEAIQAGKINDQDKPKAYLFGICRNMIRNHIKATIKDREEVSRMASQDQETFYFDNHDTTLSPAQVKLHQSLKQLSENCRKILTLFYYRQYSIEAIMHSMNYANENVTKSHKSRCLKTLKTIVKSNTSEHD